MKKPQDGGFIPILAPLAVGALTAIGSKITSELYDFIKKKFSGGSIKFNHKSNIEKRDFMINLLKSK